MGSLQEVLGMSKVERARSAIATLLCSYIEADTNEREQIARLISRHLTVQGGRSLAEMASDALAAARCEDLS